MLNFITPMLDILTRLWGCSTHIRDFEENLTSLRDKADELHNLFLDVEMKVEVAEEQQKLRRLNEVNDWLCRVVAMEREVQAILLKSSQDITHNRCLGCYCFRNCPASCKLGRVITQKISEIVELIDKGHFDVVTHVMPCATVIEEMPLEKIVGLESTFNNLCGCFDDDNSSVGIVGLYGMGGVGKTTLLKKFNNHFLPTRSYDMVIWVVVSKEANVEKVQQIIRNKLNVPDFMWVGKTMNERAILLYYLLKRKKFVLLLDDLWERIDLLKLGIPLPDMNNGSKVIFTTRSMEVCCHMEANRCIKVECLGPEKAFELFREKVGEETLNSHPEIFHLAKTVAEECQGLPLALCTVGRSMAGKTLSEWKRAIQILKNYPSRFSGMVDYVYYLLEFSYNSLPSATHKSCFLYCSIFPEDYNIRKDELIQLWIGEGLLTEFDGDIYEARNQGEDIIRSLKFACMLEEGDSENQIKMHDVIRDMALWLACDHGSNSKFLVKDGASNGSFEAYNPAKWKEVEILSLWGPSIRNLSGKPDCSNLSTMLVRNTALTYFPAEIFVTTSTIRVLDLSGNQNMRELPAVVGKLVNLHHLDLSGTDIKELPIVLQNLKKLRCLLLNSISELTFPRSLISSLLLLQVFSKLQGQDEIRSDPDSKENVLLQELECLEHLQDISIALLGLSSTQFFLSSPKLQRCIRQLRMIKHCNYDISFSSLRRMVHLEVLSISDCKSLTFHMEKETSQSEDSTTEYNPMNSKLIEHDIVICLRELYLDGCGIFDLNWLIFAPSLQILSIYDCPSLEEVIGEEYEVLGKGIFSGLEILDLDFLPNLRSICSKVLQFPCLKEICVADCPKLNELPFDSNSAFNSLKHIKGQKNWWGRLQWEDEATKDLFGSKFVPLH